MIVSSTLITGHGPSCLFHDVEARVYSHLLEVDGYRTGYEGY